MDLITKEKILDFQKGTQNDPISFVEKVLGDSVWEKQKEILEAVRDNKEVAVRSCHASGKSYIAGRIVHWWLNSYEDAVVITTAPTFRQVKEVLWREIRNSASGKHIYPKGAVLDTQINISDKWFALGLSTDKPDQFQGFHSSHLLVLIDEASGIQPEIEEAIDGLTPTKIVRIGNPLQNTGRFADCFRQADVKKMQISAFDVPNVKENKIVIPGLITKSDIEHYKARYGEDSDVYRVRVLGEFPLQDAESLIGIDEVSKAMERVVEVNPQFEKRMGVDIARFGNDRSVIVVRHMDRVIKKVLIRGQDLMSLAGQVIKVARDEYIKGENIYLDVIGYGAGVVDRLLEQGWSVNGVNVAEKADDNEHYANTRAELYNRVKDWLRTGQLLRDDDFYELSAIKYKFTSTGKMLMESKDDMKKRGLDSPDVADALMLTFANAYRFQSTQASEPVKHYYPELGI